MLLSAATAATAAADHSDLAVSQWERKGEVKRGIEEKRKEKGKKVFLWSVASAVNIVADGGGDGAFCTVNSTV